MLYMIHKLYIGFYPNFVLVFKIWVLDSCPYGPGLSKIIEWSPLLIRQDWNQRGRYSLAVLPWGLLLKVNIVKFPWGRITCPYSKFFSILSHFLSLQGFRPTKLDTKFEPTQLRLWQAALFVFIQRGAPVERVLTHVRATSLRSN